MFDPSTLKYVFIDYDDTLCVHMRDKRGSSTWFKAMFTGDVNFYGEPDFCKLPGMERFLGKLKAYGCDVYGLTWADYSFTVDVKNAWVQKNYPGKIKSTIGVGCREKKVIFITEFMKMVECRPDEILVVDDHPDTLSEALDVGFQAMSASEVCGRFAL